MKSFSEQGLTMKALKISALAAVALFVLGACAEHANHIKPKEKAEIRVNRIARTQLPPQPAYTRLRYGVTPDTKPLRHLDAGEQRGKLFPRVTVKVKNKRLEDVVATIAGTAKYSSFTESTIANQRISLHALGTVEELAEQVEQIAGIVVQVDHQGKSLRAFEDSFDGGRLEAGFYEGE